jgi:uncharacterized protein (DUF885 family)
MRGIRASLLVLILAMSPVAVEAQTGAADAEFREKRAIDYLGGSRESAEREVERYMVWPGQALGYKIGQLKDGAMPLSILEAKMDRWLAARKVARATP